MTLSRLALAVALLPVATQAAEALQTAPLVITSGRQAEPRAEATAANSVFTRQDIERLQARSVPELLARTPGIQMGSSGGVPAYYVRGTGTAQTLVLVDGQRIASATTGIARLDYLSIDNIERIEIARGPRSSLYGADAIGGVIQIFTRRGENGLHPEVRMAAGSRGTVQRSATLSGSDEQTAFNLGASLDESNGWDRTRDKAGADIDHDGQRNKAVHLNLDQHFNEDWKAGISLNDQRGDSEYDDAYSAAPGEPHDEFRVSSYSGYVEAQLSKNWNSRVEAGRSYDRNKALGAADSWNNGTLETTRHSLSWLNHLQLTDVQRLSIGTDWYEDRVNGNTAFAEDSRENRAVFAQHSFRTDQFSTELGVRHDDNQVYGSQNSWNGALSLPAGDSQSWILSYGEGFRAPTFSDLYYPGAGNPDLQAETSKTYELQWRGNLSSTQLEASVYRTDVDDLIAWNGAAGRPENISRARINGFEAQVSRDIFGWRSALSLSLLDPRNRDTGSVLPNRAKRLLSLDLDRQIGRIGFGATWQAVSHSFDDSAAGPSFSTERQTVAGYGLLNLRSSWQATPELTWEAKIDNLLDRDYARSNYQREFGDLETVYGYREAGRTALFAVTWTPEL